MKIANVAASAILVALATSMSLPINPAQAQLGGQPIKVVFPYAAGGTGDALARIIAERIGKELKRGHVVENRTGAGGRIGIKAVKDAAPDGDTIMMLPFAPMSIFPHFFGDKLGYDPVKDFIPVSQPVSFEFALAVGPMIKANDAKELAAALKANPDKATYGTPGAGTLPHFLGLEFGKLAGAKVNHLPFRGSALGINDLVAGQLPFMVTTTADFVAQHDAGKIRIVGTFGDKPSVHAKGVKTMQAQGFNLVGYGWYGVYVPAKTPAALVDRYSRIIAALVREPAMSAKLVKLGLDPTGTTGPELAAIQKRDLDFWAGPVKSSGFTPKQ